MKPSDPITHEQAHMLEEALHDAFDVALDDGKPWFAKRIGEAAKWLGDMQRYTTPESMIILDNSTAVTLFDAHLHRLIPDNPEA